MGKKLLEQSENQQQTQPTLWQWARIESGLTNVPILLLCQTPHHTKPHYAYIMNVMLPSQTSVHYTLSSLHHSRLYWPIQITQTCTFTRCFITVFFPKCNEIFTKNITGYSTWLHLISSCNCLCFFLSYTKPVACFLNAPSSFWIWWEESRGERRTISMYKPTVLWLG